jgi:hypothetical protein
MRWTSFALSSGAPDELREALAGVGTGDINVARGGESGEEAPQGALFRVA